MEGVVGILDVLTGGLKEFRLGRIEGRQERQDLILVLVQQVLPKGFAVLGWFMVAFVVVVPVGLNLRSSRHS
jgi:hypothetical protein